MQWKHDGRATTPRIRKQVANDDVFHRTLDNIGSGSTYIYGYCDATYRDGMSKDECIEFVKNCKSILSSGRC